MSAHGADRSRARPKPRLAIGRVLATAGAALVLASACGDPLVTSSYRGAPLWSLPLDISRGSSVPRGTVYRAALFFQPHLDTVDPEQMTELEASSVDVNLPSSIVFNAYEAPGPNLMIKASDGKSMGFAVARLFLYDDLDGDGRRSPGEPFEGGMAPVAVLYAPRDLGPGESTGTGPVSAGFHVVPLPQPCTFQPPPPTTPGDCGVPLGDSCADDSVCGGGMCLRETKQPWPAGYCVVPVPSSKGCRPGAGVYAHTPLYVPLPPSLTGFYLRACKTDADCHRAHPADLTYRCEPTFGACFPPIGGMAGVGSTSEIEPLCAGGVRNVPLPSQ